MLHNLLSRRSLLIVALIGVWMPVLGLSADQGSIAGVGARPLTDTVAATWFIESVSPPTEYRMATVFFLLGPAGWTKQKTDWTWSQTDPANSTFVIGGRRIRFEYSKALGRWTALGTKGQAKDINVLVVTGLGTANQKIVHKEHLNLSVPFDSDPMREVVDQSASLRKVLGLE